MTDDRDQFRQRNAEAIQNMGQDDDLQAATRTWFSRSFDYEYSYHFRWMGLPIIQYPQDIVAMQEIIWQVKPDLIIETGVARGGSLVFYASMLKMMGLEGQVLGIDIDIRQHNREAIEDHPMASDITLIEGSSTDDKVLEQVQALVAGKQRVVVALDSLHTHDHVLRELELYSPLVTPGSYLVVFDTVIEHLSASASDDRPWGLGNNPLTALRVFLETSQDFEVDREMTDKLQITVAPDGYLKRIR